MMTFKDLLAKMKAAYKGGQIDSTLLANVLLNPAQFDRYVRTMQIDTTVLPVARQMIMDAQKQDIDRLGFGSRVMRVPPSEGEALASSEYAQPNDEKVQLVAVETQGVIKITDKLMRRNIEKANFENTIVDMFSERGGVDIEELLIQGDTGGSGYLALLDGWLVQSGRVVLSTAFTTDPTGGFTTTGAGEVVTLQLGQDGVPVTPGTFELNNDTPQLVAHDDGGLIVEDNSSEITGTIDYNQGIVVMTIPTVDIYDWTYTVDKFDATADAYPENAFERALKVVPKNYFKRPAEWKFITPWDIENEYRENLKERGTQLGDSVQTANNPLAYKGTPVNISNNMPGSRAWLMHPDNTIYGIFHQVQLEPERSAREKSTYFVLNTEIDAKHEAAEASVTIKVA